MAPERSLLVTAVAHGLPRVVADLAAGPPVDDTFLEMIHQDRLAGFVARAFEDRAIDLDDIVLAGVVQEWHRQLATSVAAEAHAVRVADVFDSAGIPWRVSKGVALAHLDYADVTVRTFGDLDVLVHPDAWVDSIRVLQAAGYHRDTPELRPGYDLRYGKGATLVAAEGLELDLHVRFAVGRFAIRSTPADLFTAPEPLVLAGRTLPALAGSGRLLHACFHAALGGSNHYRALRDVAQLLLVSGIDLEPVAETAARWRATPVVASAITQAWDTFGLDADHPAATWARDAPTRRADRRALAVFADERPFRSQALTGMGILPWWERPRYLWCLAGSRQLR